MGSNRESNGESIRNPIGDLIVDSDPIGSPIWNPRGDRIGNPIGDLIGNPTRDPIGIW